ncbi:Protein translocase subunit SecA [Gossypium arboreum]|uniref:Protein translocase subunit SecA n=1 Tax=Gossypium arboreum TaxID=29729 RepID=A0A0B0P5V3_GOSAR|nr:Protein translocase subunit SecA [Gossypium arboreum]KHG20420.1 Protein translocase subunit SecA [Gossypium arboreum]KHG21751.1 Protein translocase subunit SecA [Gossypium arboreum]
MSGTKCSPCVQESRTKRSMMVGLCAETIKYRGLIRIVQRDGFVVILWFGPTLMVNEMW